MSRFKNIENGFISESVRIYEIFHDDLNPNKINLCIGGYRNEFGRPWVLPVVRLAEKNLATDLINKEHLPLLGLPRYIYLTTKLVLGTHRWAFIEQKCFGMQTLSGTGALRVGAEFLHKVLKYKVIYISDPAWENYTIIFKHAGFSDIRQYRYLDYKNHELDIDGFLEDLQKAPKDSIIILQACAHNPAGVDPTEEQWKQIADVMQERELFPFFDSAYQGFASGDLDKDAWAIRYFIDRGFELFVAVSLSKNFSFCNERTGSLIVILLNTNNLPAIKGKFSEIVMGNFSSPPAHGARIVAYILGNMNLIEEWKQNLITMATRIKDTRKALRLRLERLGTPGFWNYITNQIGMYSLLRLSKEEVIYLMDVHHVYLNYNGRISLVGITKENVDYVANAIHDTVMHFQKEKSIERCIDKN